ncbi:polysaccharide biosynthesis/export family protein [Oricola thermophila]|uniref:Polysaccharide export protein n=1 Tax=Oricola thermophila TaxID=2742145 RepID=A0A6N1VFF9_9HYPH|nr:polysaccharide biosynthesis/export family protein [Oricola thermophila]QKV18325.1 polysaccharide export protein [Oricola thermophila]
MNCFRRDLLAFAAGALSAAMLTGCAGYRPPPAAFHEAINQPYMLGAGDKVRVTVFGQSDLSNTYSVDQSGYIAFPLIGAVAARGRTVQELEGAIAEQLRNGYLRDPDVSVEVDQYRSIFVMGEVGAAGQYPYTPGMTVQNAIATAGGFTARAKQSNVDITRQISGNVMTGSVPLSDPVLPGDTIFVRERLF